MVASGEDPEVTVLNHFPTLWKARDSSNTKHVILYSRKIPSTYAVQKIVEVFADYVKSASVTVMYSDDNVDDGCWEEKAEHINKTGIGMEKVDLA